MRIFFLFLVAAALGCGRGEPAADAGDPGPVRDGRPGAARAEHGSRERPAGGPEADSPAPAAARPNVLLLTVDTLRPDALGWVGGGAHTPHLDRLAQQGFAFPAAVAPVPLTLPSHASLMSGLVPRRHGVRDNGQVLGAEPALLAEVLSAHGWTTAAFVSGYPLQASFGLARGFGVYDDRVSAGEGAWLERPAAETTAAVRAWVRQAAEPWFLWVHYYDPHYPYTPPPELALPGPRGAYDGEVAVVDRAVGELLAALEPPASPSPPSPSTPSPSPPSPSPVPLLTVFAADHGESLGEHGEGTHGFFIYDSTVLVPLVVRYPGRVRPGRSAAPARLVDVAPTLLDLLGLAPLPGTDGVSLVPLLEGREQEVPPAYVETRQPWTSYGWAPLRSLRSEEWKLIAAPRPELYHLAEDPGEEHNVLAEERRKALELRELLAAAEAAPPAAAGTADPEALARLRALGYLGAGGGGEGEPGPRLPDPKDRAALREALTRADERLRQGDPRAALAGFEAVLAEEPANRFALARSGEALLRSGDLAAAVPRLRRAAEVSPEQPEVRELLAEALTRAGKVEAAAAEWMELIRLQPGRARAWSNLGAALGRAGKLTEAVEAYRRAVELSPGDPDRLTRLAFAEAAAGQAEVAAGHLEEVAAQVGEERFAHSGALGLLLLRLERREEARPHLARSRPEEGDFAAARYELARLEARAGRDEAARRALGEALAVAPSLRPRALADPLLAPLLR